MELSVIQCTDIVVLKSSIIYSHMLVWSGIMSHIKNIKLETELGVMRYKSNALRNNITLVVTK